MLDGEGGREESSPAHEADRKGVRMNKPENLDEAIRKCEQEIAMHQDAINQLHRQIAVLIRAARDGKEISAVKE